MSRDLAVAGCDQKTIGDAAATAIDPEVCIYRFSPDMHTVAEDVGQRVVTTLEKHPTGCIYFNPAVTVACLVPSPRFFEIVRREQARWCRQAARMFSRTVRRRVSRWVGGGVWDNHRYSRFLDRGLCFTGVLFIDGVLVPSHRWPKHTDKSP